MVDDKKGQYRVRWENLLNRKVRVYDNGGKTFDRYTVIIKRYEKGTAVYDVYSMSENPDWIQGFNQYSHTEYDVRMLMQMIGKDRKVPFNELPEAVLEAIEYRV